MEAYTMKSNKWNLTNSNFEFNGRYLLYTRGSIR